MKKALIFGVSGQDGTYLSSQLISAGYSVHGVTTQPLSALFKNHLDLQISSSINYHSLDYSSSSHTAALITTLQPDEIYILNGPSSVSYSFENPSLALHTIPNVTLFILESVRLYSPNTRIYHAASSECFGETKSSTGTKINDPFEPKSPYALAKVHSHNLIKYYRQNYNLYACSGFLYNHESHLRSPRFVTSKIVSIACQIALGKSELLSLGRLDISRDWGYAPEYTQAMHLMLSADTPRDYLICTGSSYTLKDFVELVFNHLNLSSEGYIYQSQTLCRPNDITHSQGDPSEATEYLNWTANTRLPQLVKILVEHEMKRLNNSPTSS